MKKRQSLELDTVIFRWPDKSPFTVRELLCSLLILGKTGSGKSSFSAETISNHILSSALGLPVAMLVLCAKPEDRAVWEARFKNADRKYRVFSPRDDLRLNFLEFEGKRAPDSRSFAKFITTIGEMLDGGSSGGREDGAFWEKACARLLENAVHVVRLAYGVVDAMNLLQFISGIPNVPAEMKTEAFEKSFHWKTFVLAYDNVKTSRDRADLDLAREYFHAEMANLNDRTRSSITIHATQTLSIWNTGLCRELIGGETNFTIDCLNEGESILVDCSPSEFGDVGRVIQAGFRYLTQRMILRRTDGPVILIWVDEYPATAFENDAIFLSRSRSHKGCMCILMQGVSNLQAVLKGESGKHLSEVILGQCGTKVIHAVDPFSAQFASQLLGRRIQRFIGCSLAPAQNAFQAMFGPSRITTSISQQYSEIVQPAVFMQGRMGPDISDAIVIKTEPFANGENWLKVAFERK